MQIYPNIFKAYDIRGIYPEQLNEEVACGIGFCFAKQINATKIVVGRDMRISSDKVFQALARGINQAGAEVIDIGLVSTDATYYASGKLGLPAAMITASHNPSQWNGFKLTKADAVPFGDEDIKILKESVTNYEPTSNEIVSKIIKKDIVDDYDANVLNFINKEQIKNLKIVVDAGNGMGGKILSSIYKNLNCEIIPLYFELDGSFPNHQPSPIESKNLVDLQNKIKETKADFGMAFDGDADRVFFVDENAEVISGASIVAILAKYFLDRHPGEKIIYDLRCSHFIPELIKANGGEPLISRVGHSFIKKMMKETGAVYGGEISGHYYFRENYRADSGMITAVIITQIISTENKPLSEISKEYSKYYQIEETNSEVDDKDKKIEELKEKYSDGNIFELDGVTVEYEDWWFNVRPSNTEPLLRLNLEAKSKDLLEQKTNEVLNIIRS